MGKQRHHDDQSGRNNRYFHQTNCMYSIEMIRNAMNHVEFDIHLSKPASMQYQHCFNALQIILPMEEKEK